MIDQDVQAFTFIILGYSKATQFHSAVPLAKPGRKAYISKSFYRLSAYSATLPHHIIIGVQTISMGI